MTNKEWKRAKDYMLPYEGLASQIYILDIQRVNVVEIVRTIDLLTVDSTISVLGNYMLDNSVEISHVNQREELALKLEHGQTTIHSYLFNGADITFDLWVEADKEFFDLEVWFWADQIFTDSDSENHSRFSTFLTMIKSIVSNSNYRCILTPFEAGDPRDHLANGFALAINLESA